MTGQVGAVAVHAAITAVPVEIVGNFLRIRGLVDGEMPSCQGNGSHVHDNPSN